MRRRRRRSSSSSSSSSSGTCSSSSSILISLGCRARSRFRRSWLILRTLATQYERSSRFPRKHRRPKRGRWSAVDALRREKASEDAGTPRRREALYGTGEAAKPKIRKTGKWYGEKEQETHEAAGRTTMELTIGKKQRRQIGRKEAAK
eukprot:1907584-Pleurochrysis_carterae.AAC.1